MTQDYIGTQAPPVIGLEHAKADFTAERQAGANNPYSVATETISFAIAEIKARAPYYERMDKYYKGNHPIFFALYEDGQQAFKNLFKAFADNLCQLPVDSVSERLEITAFSSEDKNAEISKKAWGAWATTKGNLAANKIHAEALRQGDGYAIVWPDAKKRPRVWPQRAKGVYCHHNEENPDEILWAFKWWLEPAQKRVRANLYYPDKIEKYVQTAPDSSVALPDNGKDFVAFQTPGEPWPLANPWGRVPVFHFANAAPIGESGVSEIEIGIPLQNALNKSIVDMIVGGEYHALPQRWVTGLEIYKDEETGAPVKPFKPGAERVWTAANDLAKFGQFDTADLEKFIAVQENLRTEFGRVCGLPAHYITQGTGQFPSGEALRTAEARLVKKCEDRQTDFGCVWGEVASFMLQILGETTESLFETTWKPADSVSPESQLNVATLKKGVGVSTSQILEELGYSEEKIKAMIDENGAAVDASLTNTINAFNKGQGGL